MLKLKEVSKIYGDGIKALDEADVEIKEGEFVVILGPSGAGKSTLLRCINRLIEPTHGRIYLNGEEITSLCGRKLHKMSKMFCPEDWVMFPAYAASFILFLGRMFN